MIKNVASLLEALAKKEQEKLDEFDISHTVTIGQMYEGLTKELLKKVLPTHLDLKIVDGFIHDGFGNLSGQIDCMLVRGQGEKIPYVEGSYKWHIFDVIAVFEIKKKLFAAQLEDSFEHLKSVSEIYSNCVQNTEEEFQVNLDASIRNYSQITGKILPNSEDWKNLPMNLHLIWHCLMFDQLSPARIVFGYDGYKKEKGLRDGFSNFLESNLGKQGYGIPSIPNLIIANGFSLIKTTGHPYFQKLRPDGFWPVVTSSNAFSLQILLEIIWTKLSYIENMPELFGEDLELEVFHAFLWAKPVQNPLKLGQWGWQFERTQATDKVLAEKNDFSPWEPEFLTFSQNTVVARLCIEGEIKITDPEFLAYLDSENEDLDEFLKGLIKTKLVAEDGDLIRLTTFDCMMVVLPDGRFAAAENNTGRFSRWLSKYMAEFRDKAE